MTKEEYKKTFNRICNRRNDGFCYGCFLEHYCTEHPVNTIESVIELLERLEIWAEENPVKTNRDKFEEVFGVRPKKNENAEISPCDEFDINPCECIQKFGSVCSKCRWWDEEYINPIGE